MPKASKFSPDEGLTIYDLKDNEAVHWADNNILGAKNRLQNKGISRTGDISFTVNSDGSVSLNGSHPSADIFEVNAFTGAQLKALGSQLILSGGDEKAYIAIRTSTWTFIARSYGTDVLFNTSNLDDNTTYYVTIGVQGNTNVDGVTLYPMIRLASDTDNTYIPYSMTNRELGDAITGIKLDNCKIHRYSYSSLTPKKFTIGVSPTFIIGKHNGGENISVFFVVANTDGIATIADVGNKFTLTKDANNVFTITSSLQYWSLIFVGDTIPTVTDAS